MGERNSETWFAGLLCIACAAMFYADMKATALVIVSVYLMGFASRYDDLCNSQKIERKYRAAATKEDQ